ncbi:prepilin-type N-terminal cleavage/methylation domain-containing protein [Variovorax dokdonensis]|uniref:Prepilin-type N-terminal cleavage/methylation domain-containing protein n=2 Tax=Variovorax dokdonensis TaxID=344883 RepID=A0ABT7NBS3_9BURK|nr:prepilin-type N-terminal cleavage/methylation domain-containing protein [Variovorax dokdonensis]MDM0045340.1 prepilin-type N-terminal cleavage/methylation domain-containing protein [Variovorax dokdonensis]
MGGGASRSKASRGFTLIELLVVIAIVAMAMAGVGLALRDTRQAALDREAERLAALFESARAQSRASGSPVRWRVTERGFVFDGLEPDALPDHWLAADVRVLALAANGRRVPALVLGPEPIIAAQQVVLSDAQEPTRSLIVGSDGLRPFSVITP